MQHASLTEVHHDDAAPLECVCVCVCVISGGLRVDEVQQKNIKFYYALYHLCLCLAQAWISGLESRFAAVSGPI